MNKEETYINLIKFRILNRLKYNLFGLKLIYIDLKKYKLIKLKKLFSQNLDEIDFTEYKTFFISYFANLFSLLKNIFHIYDNQGEFNDQKYEYKFMFSIIDLYNKLKTKYDNKIKKYESLMNLSDQQIINIKKLIYEILNEIKQYIIKNYNPQYLQKVLVYKDISPKNSNYLEELKTNSTELIKLLKTNPDFKKGFDLYKEGQHVQISTLLKALQLEDENFTEKDKIIDYYIDTDISNYLINILKIYLNNVCPVIRANTMTLFRGTTLLIDSNNYLTLFSTSATESIGQKFSSVDHKNIDDKKEKEYYNLIKKQSSIVDNKKCFFIIKFMEDVPVFSYPIIYNIKTEDEYLFLIDKIEFEKLDLNLDLITNNDNLIVSEFNIYLVKFYKPNKEKIKKYINIIQDKFDKIENEDNKKHKWQIDLSISGFGNEWSDIGNDIHDNNISDFLETDYINFKKNPNNNKSRYYKNNHGKYYVDFVYHRKSKKSKLFRQRAVNSSAERSVIRVLE